MRTVTVNTSDLELIRARQSLGVSYGGVLDSKRPTAWVQYGYPEEVTFHQLHSAYRRGGAGFGAVHRILDKCWQEAPRIKSPGVDAETPWETKVKTFLDSISAWQKLREFDRRNMVGRYAGLIYRVADSLALSQPMLRAQRLVDIVPVFEDQIKVTEWDSNTASENFGKPRMWQYRMRRPAGVDTQGAPDQWVDVHPSRIQILAEGSVGDFLDGVPLLQAGFNNLVDLEKISGGSAESFLKNSARTLVFQYEADANVQAIQQADGSTKSVREIHEEQTRNLNANQDSAIVIQGGEANTLQTTVSDPTGAFQLAANLFSASVQIPFTVLFGQQTGRLASDEDKEDMVARCKSRQRNELTPMLAEFVRRMQAAGLVDAGEFEIEWPPLDAPGDTDKATLLGKMTSAMQQAFQSGLVEPLFDANELRGVMSFDERGDDGMPEPGREGGEPEELPEEP